VVAAPVPPLAIGRTPVTPVVRGRPVALVKVNAVGVPNAGVTKVGLVANTTAPLPVVEAALIAVPLPCKIPVIVVESVIAGVVVAVATVPAKPFALTTETLVTVPVPDGKSAMTKARKVGVAPLPLVGPAHTVLAA